jgi:hypothetical protein
MADIDTHPRGYPRLGLKARTVNLDTTDPAVLTRRIERWERRMGNSGFEARNLHRPAPEVAAEMANVYVALRERYPTVRPEYVDFASGDVDKGTLGTSLIYPAVFPTLRTAADLYDVDDLDELVDVATIDADPEVVSMRRSLRREAQWIAGVRDVTCSGAIDMSRTFATKKHYAALVTYWERRNELARAAGRPPRVPQLAVSPVTFVLLHEFGHLVDGELLSDGYENGVDTYGAISAAVFGIDQPAPTAWRYHLINYPAAYAPTETHGPYGRNKDRAAETKQRLRWVIGETLGSYAWNSRDEVFAEAFALAQGGSTALRTRLAPMLRALETAGLRRRVVRSV